MYNFKTQHIINVFTTRSPTPRKITKYNTMEHREMDEYNCNKIVEVICTDFSRKNAIFIKSRMY